MEIEEILNILPHRYPFLLIDRILELQPGQRAVGIKCVSYNEPFFQGHFPGCPIMPAVLIVEAMAQVGGVLLLSMVENKGKLAVFAGIDRTKFRRPVKPGDTLVMEAETIKIKGSIGKIRVSACVEGSRVAEGELMFAMVEHPGTQPGDYRNLTLATPTFR